VTVTVIGENVNVPLGPTCTVAAAVGVVGVGGGTVCGVTTLSSVSLQPAIADNANVATNQKDDRIAAPPTQQRMQAHLQTAARRAIGSRIQRLLT
jgi:hypothetical protein